MPDLHSRRNFIINTVIVIIVAAELLFCTSMILFFYIYSNPECGCPSVLVGEISLTQENPNQAKLTFNGFSERVQVEDIIILIELGESQSMYYFDNSTHYFWLDFDEPDPDGAGTGVALNFIDNDSDGYVENGDYCIFAILPDNEYTVNIIVNGDIVSMGTLVTDDTTLNLVGTLSLDEVAGGNVECRFGSFSPTVPASYLTIVIANGSGECEYCYVDDDEPYWEEKVPGTSVVSVASFQFIDLGGDGMINNGDRFLVPIWPDCLYTVKVLFDGYVVCEDSLAS